MELWSLLCIVSVPLNNNFYCAHTLLYMYILNLVDNIMPYSGKHLREKVFTNFAVLEPPTKVFFSKFGGAVPTY